MDLEHVVARLARQVEHRFYGKHRGFVIDNDDPERLGRLRVCIPSVLGRDVVTGWAMPCVPYGGTAEQGSLFVPDVDAGVWVEFEEGDPEFPIWVGTFWSKPGGSSELPTPVDADGQPHDLQRPPTRKIIKTARGHTLQFEDADDADDEETHVILSDGQQDNRIILGRSGTTIIGHTNSITMEDNGVVIVDTNGNTLRMQAGGMAINGGDSGSKVCVEGLVDWLMQHKHTGNMGAPCPLSPDAMAELVQLRARPGEILSGKVTVS